MLLGLIVVPGFTRPPGVPLTQTQVMDLVKYGMESAHLATIIKEHGIDFEPKVTYEDSLRRAGAQIPVILALGEVRPKPLTREQVGKLVAGGVPSPHAVALIQQRSVDFPVDEPYLATLRVAGADDDVIAALRMAGAVADVRVVTVPGASVFIDGRFQGWSNLRGELTLKTRLGAHDLKVTHWGRKPFTQSLNLTTGEGVTLQARLVDNTPGELSGKPPAPIARNHDELVAIARERGAGLLRV